MLAAYESACAANGLAEGADFNGYPVFQFRGVGGHRFDGPSAAGAENAGRMRFVDHQHRIVTLGKLP